jgi:hypothetical protein
MTSTLFDPRVIAGRGAVGGVSGAVGPGEVTGVVGTIGVEPPPPPPPPPPLPPEGGAVIVQLYVAGVGSSLPAASVAVTAKV